MIAIRGRTSRASGASRAALAALGAIATAAALGLAGCGGSSGSSVHAVAGPGVSFLRPSGWSARGLPGGGVVIAAAASDLSAAAPSGPRFTAQPAGALPDARSLGRTLSSVPQDIELVGQPAYVAVGRVKGAEITVREPRAGRSIVAERVFVPVSRSRAYSFTLESPADSWASNEKTLTDILSSVRVNPSAVPLARG